MPTPEQILTSLSAIASQWWLLAVAWHVYFGVLAAGLLLGRRPAQRTAALLLALPLLSVSVMAWMAANPFNGLVFGLLGLALLILGWRLPATPVRIAAPWAVTAGVLMFVFGWVYPHFLDAFPAYAYLYAAPVGLAPCPTLSILIGLALVVRGFDSRLWGSVLGAAGLFYGLFGALRLGVTIDLVLLAGALLLLACLFLPSAQPRPHTLAHS